MRASGPRAAAFALLVLVPILASWPAFVGFSADPIHLMSGLAIGGRPGLMPGTTSLDLNVGVTTQALGHLAAEQWLAGQVPWWNPYNGIGMPLAGEMQASALFLPFVLLLHFESGTLLLKLSMQILAGLFMAALLLRLETGRLAATLGGLLFGLCGTFAWLGHGPIMPVAFLPLLLLGIEHARSGGFRLIAVAIAGSLYAGFPETAYLDGLLALGWAGLRVAGDPRPFAMAGRVALGGVIGLALAAPALWSFAHLLLHGTSANHALPLSMFGSGFAPAPPASPAALPASWLFPYLTGPLMAFQTPASAAALSYQGGYLGALPLLLALLGLFGRSHRGLRLVLAGWIVLLVGGTDGVPGLDAALYAVPLLRQVIVARYGVPSCCLAALVLAMLAIADWRAGAPLPWRRAGFGFAALVGLSFVGAWPAITGLAGAHGWTRGSVLWAGGVLAFAVVLMRRPCRPASIGLLAAVLVADAAAMFAVPLLAGPRDAAIDLAAIRFLQESTGLQRFATLGPYRPNYGAFFATPQLNHEYLPLPANWARHVETALDPSASVIMFRGDEPPLPPKSPSHGAQLASRRDAYAALGVRFILTRPGDDPFSPGFDSQADAGHATPFALPPGAALAGEIEGAVVKAGPVVGVGVDLATYLGRADGTLELQLCTASACVTGSIPLAGAADNARAMVTLASPLAVRAGEALRWRIRHQGGAQAVAIWLPAGDRPQPLLHVAQSDARPAPPRVYRDALMDIYRLPDTAPYFDTTGGPCRLDVHDRFNVEARCEAPARLIRRELFFSGWRAWSDGRPRKITAVGDVMQQVDLQPGAQRIRFAYAPPHIGWCWAALGLGIAGLNPFRLRRLFSRWRSSA